MTEYTFKEVVEASKEYFNGDELAAEVFTNKYALKNKEGVYFEKTPTDMHKRLSKEFARVEKKFPNPLSQKEIFELFDHFRFAIPQGSPMSGIGNLNQLQSLANCFVVECVDSYGGICRTDERIAQISKRRGGCVRSDSNVLIKNKGLVKIKDINIGDYIFSYNKETQRSEFKRVLDHYYTDVKKEDQVEITTSNGSKIFTSKKHPILTIKDDKYTYIKAGGIQEGDILIAPESDNINYQLFTSKKEKNKEESDIGWFIGAHTGDETAGLIFKDWNKDLSKGTRLRILGDNENVIKEYARICNLLCESNANYTICSEKRYKTKCWNYCCNKLSTRNIIDKYFDGKIGKKTYDCQIFSYIKDNNLWMPYIAGITDSDGYVKNDGSVDIAMCAQDVIYGIFSWLQCQGIRSSVSVKVAKRPNEKDVCRLRITDRNFILRLSYLMKHDKKIYKIQSSNDNYRSFSYKYQMTNGEIDTIVDSYNSQKYKKNIIKNASHNNKMAIIKLMKENKALGLGGLNNMVEHNFLTEQDKNNIMQRRTVKFVNTKIEKEYQYIDISVEGNNNYYAGTIGLLNIHNCGLDISPIRPKGLPTNNSSLTTDGIALFMERYSRTIREVGQSGRRGALLLSISVHHPEIKTFINIKRDLEKVTGANISVRITDEFMKAVKADKKYQVRWPVDSDNPSISEKISAKEIWGQLVKSNYLSAEPGMLFWDTIINNSPADSYASLGFKSLSTNPCGELPLSRNSSCILLALNLSSYVKKPFTQDAKFDIGLYKKHVRIGQKLLDDLIELELEAVNKIINKIENDPEDEEIKANELSLWKSVKDVCEKGRRIGLGVTALGDCIAMLNHKYGDKKSLRVVDMVYSNLRDEAYRSSIELAKERGAFPIFDPKIEKDNQYLNRLPDDIKKDMAKHGRRNIGLLTTAPAGSVSVLAQTSSGFEPVFKAVYFRKRKLMESESNEEADFIDKTGDKWKEYPVYHHGLRKYIEITGKKFEDSPYNGAEADSINHLMRVKMQATATKYVDHSISSTVNLPNDIKLEVVNDLYMEAWKSGCKGLTIYRDGSRVGVLTAEKTEKQPEGKKCEDCKDASQQMLEEMEEGYRPPHITVAFAPKRSGVLECDIHRSKVGGGEWLFFIGMFNKQPYEIFGGNSAEFSIPHKYKNGWIIKNGKVEGVTQYNLILGSLEDENEKLEFKGIAKHFNNYEYGAFTRLASLTIRHGVSIKYVCEQITKKGVEGDLFSFQRAMARVLKKYIGEGEESGLECPDCGSSDMVYKNGCPACMVCGFSHCS